MAGSGKKCGYKYPDHLEHEACFHPNYKGDFCLFHHPNVEGKEDNFQIELDRLIEKTESDDSIERHDFIGFLFPKVSFSEKTLKRIANFSYSSFSGDANFSHSSFSGDATFSHSSFSGFAELINTSFSGDANFSHSRFRGFANFNNSRFRGYATFSHNSFSGYASFINSSFKKSAPFINSNFNGDVYFMSSSFSGDVNFSHSSFSGDAYFRKTQFKQRAEFSQARFHNEIRFEGSKLAFLKNLKNSEAQPINFRGAVLEAAHLWGINRLEKHDFSGAFLLSLSLANKEIIGCDFTGAVFDAVHTRGWKPDPTTLANTRYIYTDYRVEDGEYIIEENSRVPADGDFGEGENAGFTIADYLKDPVKWSVTPNVPPHIRSAVASYFAFFTDFMRVTEDIDVEIRSRQEGAKIRVEFYADSEEKKEKIQAHFQSYLKNIKDKPDNLEIHFNNDKATQVEKDLLEINYKHRINSLQTELSFTQRLLNSEEEKVHILKFQNDPQSFMPPLIQEYDTQVFIMNADIAGFSQAVQDNPKLHREVPRFLFEQQTQLSKQDGYELAKLDGDCILTFFNQGLELVWGAEDLLHAMKKLSRKHKELTGLRIILGHGICHRRQEGNRKDFSCDAIVETVRCDQPMKKYIAAHSKEKKSQIWCTQAFYEEMNGNDKIKFEPLPELLDMAKGYGKAQLYRVLV
jgi:uncharacterized protein YjbI with pentapeptide repeats